MKPLRNQPKFKRTTSSSSYNSSDKSGNFLIPIFRENYSNTTVLDKKKIIGDETNDNEFVLKHNFPVIEKKSGRGIFLAEHKR